MSTPLLTASGPFTDLDSDALTLLGEGSVRRSAEAGEEILSEGAENASLFVIVSGSARVVRAGVESEVELASLDAGAIFGEMSIVEGRLASASVVAAEPVDLIELPFTAIESVLEEHPAVAARFWRNLSTELKRRLETTNQLVEHYVDLSQVLAENPGYADVIGRV